MIDQQNCYLCDFGQAIHSKVRSTGSSMVTSFLHGISMKGLMQRFDSTQGYQANASLDAAQGTESDLG